VLLSPELPVVTISLRTSVTNRPAATRAVVAALEANGIVVIPDGKNLAMITPKSWQKTARPLSFKIKSYIPSAPTRDAIQQITRKGSVNLRHASALQLVSLYASIDGGRRLDPASTIPLTVKDFSFRTQNELTGANFSMRSKPFSTGKTSVLFPSAQTSSARNLSRQNNPSPS
jgi:hypothetical protein